MSVIDDVGYWTEIKLAILRDYSAAYTKIMKSQPYIKEYAYIDGFAGAGKHVSRETGETVEGSPSIALNLPNKFTHYHFIDLDGRRIAYLRQLSEGQKTVSIWEGDCNDVLLNKVLPHYTYEGFRRALCLLDPYNLNPNWAVVKRAGELGTVDIFLNFMIMDANLNVLFDDPGKATATQKTRFTEFWGDTSWEKIAYEEEVPDLFGLKRLKKVMTETIMEAYRQRLKRVAGFKYVPAPIPMRNTKGVPIYYLFFASQKDSGNKIATAIFEKFRDHRTK